MIVFLTFYLLAMGALGSWCCKDFGTAHTNIGNCQAKNTPHNGNHRVHKDARNLPFMDSVTNVHNKIAAAYNDPLRGQYPGAPTCCVKACCHKTTTDGVSFGEPHMTVFCNEFWAGTNVMVHHRFRNGGNDVHYDCKTGEVQAFARRLDDPRSGMTLVSEAPEWLVPELKAPGLPLPIPEPRRRMGVIGETGLYKHIVRGCVGGHNIVKYTNKNIVECINLCDARDDCVAFEYGVAYGGGGGYQAKDCQLQSSANYGGCDGGYYNLDLYIKTGGYRHLHRGCVNGHNIVKYSNKNMMECVRLCDARADCLAFEYGVAYGGSGGYRSKDCQLQSSANFENCDGGHHNLDLYIKTGKLDDETVHHLKHEETHHIGFLGCFTDDGHRDLDYYKGNGHTAPSCSEACEEYNYFALQYHGQCFCGNAYQTASRYYPRDARDCGEDLLGRAWTNAVFVHGGVNGGLKIYEHSDFTNPRMSSLYGSFTADKAMDGNPDTFMHTNQGTRQWLRWDLKQATTVSRVLVANRKDCCAERLGEIDVLLYAPSRGWVQCQTSVQTSSDVVNDLWTEVYCVRPTYATTIQVQFADGHNSNFLQVSEVKVVGMLPHAQYIGCFRDDGNRDLQHYKGTCGSHEDCRQRCTDYYYFAMQYYGQCFCGDNYATAEKYNKLSDSNCGSDLKGRAWTNAVFATHGGIPEHDFDASRRRVSRPLDSANSMISSGSSDSMWKNIAGLGLQMLDETVVHALCIARDVEDRVVKWIEAHPAQFIIAAIGTVALIGLAIFFAPVIAAAVGGGFAALGLGEAAAIGGGEAFALSGAGAIVGEEAAAIIQAAIKGGLGPLLPALPVVGGAASSVLFVGGVQSVVDAVVPSNHPVSHVVNGVGDAVNAVGDFFGGLFGRRRVGGPRRRVSEESMNDRGDYDESVDAYLRGQLNTVLESGDNMHETLIEGLTLLMAVSGETKLAKEWDVYNVAMEHMNLDLDEELQTELETYFETFNELLETNFDAAEECVEAGGCTTSEMRTLIANGTEAPAPESGEGSGVGSAQPPVGPTHATTPTTDPMEEEEEIVDLGLETLDDLPEIDTEPKASLVVESADGSIVLA